MEVEGDYFREYEDLEIHELMLKDRPRQLAYREAIANNSAIFKDKIVLDVGAGTGILSLFCAKFGGAKLVYAVEASNLAKLAIEIVEENNLSDVVKVIQSTIENFQLPTDKDKRITKVDIIVSEWMGFYLLHEGMLDSVIFARDNFLKEDGLMFPQYATIFVSPCEVPSLDYWENVDGIRMTKFAEHLREKRANKPDIMVVNSENLLQGGVVMNWLDLSQITVDELNEISLQEVVAIQKQGKFQGLCIWFECQFPTSSDDQEPVILSTSPNSLETHWKQCVIVLPPNACDAVDEGEPIAFKIAMKRSCNNSRKYNLEVEILNPETVEHPLPCYCHMTKCILTRAHLENVRKNCSEQEMAEV